MTIPAILRVLTGLVATMAAVLQPWLDLAIRLWLAQAFLALQMHAMMADGNDAPLPAGLLHDITGSYAGMAFQALCPVLLAIGLLARPAAMAMLLQALLLPPAGDTRLFWIALLLRVVVLGAGLLSMDRLLQGGARSLALPGAAAMHDAFDWLRRRLGPVYLLSLRLWLAAAPVGIALAALSQAPAMRPGAGFWLPNVPAMVAELTPGVALLLAVLLAVGAGTRLAAVVLLVLVPFSQLATGDERLYWALLLAIVALHGAGPYSLDTGLAAWFGRRATPLDRSGWPHVVVVGGGFGGIATVRGLRAAPCRITLIDQRNHHLFQPLLYQVATAALAPTDIASPVRDVVRGAPGQRVLMETVTGIDTVGRRVLCGPRAVPYDTLVVSTGSKPSYFGHEDWAANAVGLKTLDDALTLRGQIMTAFEAAALADTEAERDRLLTFVLIGGGPNGVEMAGSIAGLAEEMLRRNYAMPGARARIVVVEAGHRILSGFAPNLSEYSRGALESLGVEVRTGCKVTSVKPYLVETSGGPLQAGVIVWTAGTEATPVADWLGVTAEKGGLVAVGPDLQVPGLEGVFVIGDAALVHGRGGHELPALAPVAKQEGRFVARAIRRGVQGLPAAPLFRYRDYGTLATIGRNRGIAQIGPVQLTGFLGWLTWAVAHIFFLIGYRNRVLVSMQWVFAYVLNQRSGRLITGAPSRLPPSSPPPQPPVAKPGYSVMPPSTNKVAPVT